MKAHELLLGNKVLKVFGNWNMVTKTQHKMIHYIITRYKQANSLQIKVILKLTRIIVKQWPL